MKLSNELNHDLPKPRVNDSDPSTGNENSTVEDCDTSGTIGINETSMYWSSIERFQETLSLEDSGPTTSGASSNGSTRTVLVRQDTLKDTPFTDNLNSDRPGLTLRPLHSTFSTYVLFNRMWIGHVKNIL